MNYEEIENTLPFAKPYIMIDSLEIEEEGKRGTALKNLTGQEFYFEGHFPGRPVMPGVLIIETISQAAMALLNRKDLKLSQVLKIKFKTTIEPPCSISVPVSISEYESGGYLVRGEILKDGVSSASGELVLDK